MTSPEIQSSAGQRLPELSLPQLLDRAACGPEPLFESCAIELIRRFCAALGMADWKMQSRRGRVQHAVLNRPRLSLRGFGKTEFHVLVLAQPDDEWSAHASPFGKHILVVDELPVVLAATRELEQAATTRIRNFYALVLGPDLISELLTARNGLATFRMVLRRVFKLSELHPFDDHHPISGVFFRGREKLIDQILSDERSNYALFGPSKMGKTSLVKQLQFLTRQRHLGSQVFEKNLYGVAPTEAAFSRAVRMKVSPGSGAHYDNPEAFEQFLRKYASWQSMPVTIILDEVDQHCHLASLRVLIGLAQEGLFRIILVGRWRLCKAAKYTREQDILRLSPVSLEALEIFEAEAVLLRPLEDLGFDVTPLKTVLRSAINQCGRVPGHLHEFGKYLVKIIEDDNTVTLTEQHVQQALAWVMQMSRTCGLLEDLSDSISRAAALLVILRARTTDEPDYLWIQANLRGEQVHVKTRRAQEICDELVIHHLLRQQDGRYTVCRWDFMAEARKEKAFFQDMLQEELSSARKESSPI